MLPRLKAPLSHFPALVTRGCSVATYTSEVVKGCLSTFHTLLPNLINSPQIQCCQMSTRVKSGQNTVLPSLTHPKKQCCQISTRIKGGQNTLLPSLAHHKYTVAKFNSPQNSVAKANSPQKTVLPN